MRASRKNERLLYLVFKNKVAYLFDIDRLDFDGLRTCTLHNKKVQYEDNSEIIEERAYIIPISKAILIKDAKTYYETYRDELPN